MEITTLFPELKTAADELEIISQDPDRREEYEARLKILRDLRSQLEDSYYDGVRNGELRNKIETAKTMLLDGLDINTVSKYTGLPKEEIQSFNL